jgi:hypothetical protein
MADKKSILEEALLDIKNIQSALNANTKEILRSVAREEIDGVVKESLKEGIYDEEEVETDIEGDTDSSEEDSLVDIEGSEEVEPEMEPEMGMDADALGGEEMDMTSASDDDVIAIYKKLSGEDEIEIVGDEIRLTVSEPGEYVIKTSDLGAPAMDGEMEPEMDLEMGDDEEGVDYEIEMGDDEEGEEPSDLMPVDDEEGEEGEEAGEEEIEQIDEVEDEEETIEEKISIGTGMSVGTHRGQGPKSIGAPENPKSESVNESKAAKKLVSETTKKYNMLLTEASKLRAENQEFRTALKEFRNKLVETVVFNSNLTYVTKLFTEHATTKAEKQNIIRRFDEEVSSLKESKKLYKTIVNELETRKPINESIENKIIKEATSSSSKQLNESTAYVDPSTKRILDLINRVEKK